MRAVIVDLRGRSAAALREDGAVQRLRNEDYVLGQLLELPEVRGPRQVHALRRLGVMAAAAALVLALGAGTAYALPSGKVCLEGEQTIEYTLNCFDYVLRVETRDREGNVSPMDLDTGRLRHRRIRDALEDTLEQLEQSGAGGQEESFRLRASTGRTESMLRELEELLPRAEAAEEPGVPASGPEPAAASEPTAQPEQTAPPEPTAQPEQTAEAEQTAPPDRPAQPEQTAPPDRPAQPEQTAPPEQAAPPEQTAPPDRPAQPEQIAEPEQTAEAESPVFSREPVGTETGPQPWALPEPDSPPAPPDGASPPIEAGSQPPPDAHPPEGDNAPPGPPPVSGAPPEPGLSPGPRP